jgi:hypothetical protein
MLIHTCDQLTPERLTDILRRDGALQHGHVVRMASDAQTPNPGFTATVASLTVHDSNDATGARPPRLWLKMSTTDVHPEFLSSGRHDVEFYRTIANLSSSLPVPHCYDAAAEANALVRRLPFGRGPYMDDPQQRSS